MLPSKILVILFEGAPVHFAYEPSDAREFLADVLEWDGDAYQVFTVFAGGTAAADVTLSFADEWAGDLGYGDGDDPDDFLRPFTGFVLAHLRDDLVAKYREVQDNFDGVAPGAGASHGR